MPAFGHTDQGKHAIAALAEHFQDRHVNAESRFYMSKHIENTVVARIRVLH